MDGTLEMSTKAKFILEMSKNEFRTKVIKKIAKSREFASLISFGPESLTPNDCQALINYFKDCGIEEDVKKEDFLLLAEIIANRAANYS